MAIIVQDGFEITTNKPVDNRIVKNTLAERNSIPAEMRYLGLECYVVSENEKYVLKTGLDNAAWELSGGTGTPLDDFPQASPSLSLDFSKVEVLPPEVSYNRNSIATVYGSNGLVKHLGPNEPRFLFNPATLESKGLLIEEQRTNLLNFSSYFGLSVWSRTRTTVLPNMFTAPDGSLSASKLIMGAETGSHLLGRTVTYTAGTSYVTSIFAKKAELSVVRINPNDTTFGAGAWGAFDLSTKQTAHGASIEDIGMKELPNGWFRCWIKASVVTAGNTGVTFEVSSEPVTEPNPTNAGDGKSGIYIWGAQLEVGSFLTSYTPSTETFTSRGSTGTYVNSQGLISTALANVARYSYNPMNLSLPPTLLLENAATNLVPHSEDPSQGLSPIGITVASTSIPSPLAGVNWKLISATEVTGVHCTRATTAGVVPSGSYTSSAFVCKSGSATNSTRVYVLDDSDSNLHAQSGSFDLTRGEFISEPGSNGAGWSVTSRGAIRFPDGSFRLWITFTAPSVKLQTRVYINRGTEVSYIGTPADQILVTGFQLEEGPLSSYIPTVATTVSRSTDISTSAATVREPDVAVIPALAMEKYWGLNGSTLAFKADWVQNEGSATVGPSVRFNGTNRIRILDGASGLILSGRLNGDGVTRSSSQMMTGVDWKTYSGVVAFSLGEGEMAKASYQGGDSVILPGAGGYLQGVPSIHLGIYTSSPDVGEQFQNGTIGYVHLYPRYMSDDELKTLSSPDANKLTNIIANISTSIATQVVDANIKGAAILTDIKSNNTAAQPITTGFLARHLNTLRDFFGIIKNPQDFYGITSTNTFFELDPGYYLIEAQVPATLTSGSGTHRVQLVDDQGNTLGLSTNIGVGATGSIALLRTDILTSTRKKFQIQQRGSVAMAGGSVLNYGSVEVYSIVTITKIR